MDTIVTNVKDFTEGSKGKECPKVPRPITTTELENVYRNVLSELMEGAVPTHEDPRALLRKLIEEAGAPQRTPEYFVTGTTEHENNIRICAEQGDAIVDAILYMLNTATTAGINLSPIIFAVSHANLRKRDPHTGQYIIGPYEKVMKPKNYVPANVEKVIKRMFATGSWNVPFDFDKGEPDVGGEVEDH